MAQNPMFNEAAFERAKKEQNRRPAQDETLQAQGFIPRYQTAATPQVMTLQGTINKTFALLAFCAVGGYIGWVKAAAFSGALWMLILFGAFALAIWTSLKPSVSPVTAPIYAFGEGILLGFVSAMYNAQYQGIVLQAVLVTMLVFFVMLFVYRTGLLRVTQGFVTAVVSATAAIAILYLVSWVIMLFGGKVAYLTSSSPLSIGISVVICVVAALNLMLDFQFISVMTTRPDTPKFMEWYAGFGLLVTLVWLYIEILKLLGKAKRR
ncbi:MAG: Bax inhibitor-1/YccA family protein [Elusimicrobiaceae bacterium]|nr:Bax inhibitor-1/YccA family protein [Elusimicrobiaceae bacterium]